MGRRYSIDGVRAVHSAGKTILGLTGATTIRPRIYDLLLGSSATPADIAIQWFMQRTTAAGTSTAVTPVPLDPGDPAAISTAGQNHSAEPTYTAGAVLFHLALNQRATHRWIADPNGPIVIPATSNNGVGLFPVNSSATPNVDTMIHFEE